MRQSVVSAHVLAALCALCAGVAAAADEGPRQRPAIEAARSQAQARFEQAAAECRQRFDVNACLQQARQQHRQALAALDAERRAVDEAARRQRTADRLADADRRQAEVARRLATPAQPAADAASAARTPAVPRGGRAASAPPRADRAARAAERAAAAQRLQADIRADQERIRQRVEKRAAKGKPVAPLPAASAPP